MIDIKEVETIPAAEVCRILKLTHRKLIHAILNGTIPIGAVAEPQSEEEHYVVKIYKKRFEKYINGELKGKS